MEYKSFKEFRLLQESSDSTKKKKKKDSYFDKDAEDLFDDSPIGGSAKQETNLNPDQNDSSDDPVAKAVSKATGIDMTNNPVSLGYDELAGVAAGNDPMAKAAFKTVGALGAISSLVASQFLDKDRNVLTGKAKVGAWAWRGAKGALTGVLKTMAPLQGIQHIQNYTRGAGSSVLNMRNYTRGTDPVGVPNWQFFTNPQTLSSALRPRK